MDKETVRYNLTGPITSIFMPLNEGGSVDDVGLRKFIDVSIAGGSRSIILTAGNSHYDFLSDEEIAHVTKITSVFTGSIRPCSMPNAPSIRRINGNTTDTQRQRRFIG